MTRKTKIFLVALVGFIAAGIVSLMAQTKQEEKWGAANTSEMYYVNYPVEKVFTYRKGYVVLFRQGAHSLKRAYIPYEWFRAGVKKAELIQLGDGSAWPSMSVFYKLGDFHAVRLYVAKRASHITWGMLASTVNLDDRFEGIESVDVGFPPEQ